MIKELFRKQLENNPPFTQDHLSRMVTKSYFNGDPFKVGEVPLQSEMIVNVHQTKEGTIRFDTETIILNERHLDMFFYEPVFQDGTTPIIKMKDLETGEMKKVLK